MGQEPSVWVFMGEGATHPSAVFSSEQSAEAWIAKHFLSGVLTAYPIDRPIYELAVESGWFKPKSAEHRSSRFIQRFTSASQAHAHYEAGKRVG
jgi:hypothetical protein